MLSKMRSFKSYWMNVFFSQTVIDYVKFDVEFDEWRVLLNIIHEGALVNVKQIGFEIHTMEFYRYLNNPRLKTDTGQADYVNMYNILKQLERANFRQFNYRLNPFGEFKSPTSDKKRSCCYELHYINMNFVKANYTVLQSKLPTKLPKKTKTKSIHRWQLFSLKWDLAYSL